MRCTSFNALRIIIWPEPGWLQGDCIVTDGKSEDEALRMHLEVLPDTGADVCEVFESV